MKQTAKVLLFFFVAALFIGCLTPSASAASISDSMIFMFLCDEDLANVGSCYWNGIVVEDSEGDIHIVASYLSALDGIQNNAAAIVAIGANGSTYLTLDDYDAEAGIAVYSPYGEFEGITPLPLAPSTSIEVGDEVTVYGMEWLEEPETFEDIFHTYTATVKSGVASENQNYVFMELDQSAPDPYWASAAVMDEEGHMVAILLSSTDMTYALPAEYLLGYLGYGEDYVVPDGVDIDDVADANFDNGYDYGDDSPDSVDDTDSDGKSESLDSAISNNASNTQVSTIGSSRASLRNGIIIGVCVLIAGLGVFFAIYFGKRAKAAKAANAVPVPEEVFAPTVPGKYYIVARGGEHTGERFLIDGSVLIGRRSDVCNIILSPATYGISAEHCRLDIVDGGLELTDLGSTFGTYFEGGRLEADEPILLADGDTFSLADPHDNQFVVEFVPDVVEPAENEDETVEAEETETEEAVSEENTENKTEE